VSDLDMQVAAWREVYDAERTRVLAGRWTVLTDVQRKQWRKVYAAEVADGYRSDAAERRAYLIVARESALEVAGPHPLLAGRETP
jgi:hypothetical protein